MAVLSKQRPAHGENAGSSGAAKGSDSDAFENQDHQRSRVSDRHRGSNRAIALGCVRYGFPFFLATQARLVDRLELRGGRSTEQQAKRRLVGLAQL
jgi:hypothetical protein